MDMIELDASWPGTVEPRAIVSLAEAGRPRAIGHLASPALSIDERLTCEEVNAIFDADPDLSCVMMRREVPEAEVGIVPRLLFYRAMTGRFGYGFSLHSRRPIGEMANWTPLVVDAVDDVESVTAMVLRRPRESRREDLVVRWSDGAMGTVSAVDLFEAMAGLYGHDALHDGLTALPNRVLLRERLQATLDGLRRGGRAAAVIFIDLDDFKFINDTLGHTTGDHVLISFARRVGEWMRPGDTLARLGGDEFAVLVTDLSCPDDALAIAARLRECLRQPFEVLGHHLRVEASVGIAAATEPTSSDVMLRNADLAMYEAKREQRGAFRMFEPVMHQRAVQRAELEHDLRRAIQGDELFLVHQPVVALRDGCLGVEALVRWQHPTLGELAPARFIGLAEQSGLILELDAWVLARACQEARMSSSCQRVSVNVSAMTLDSGHLATTVADALLDSGLPASSLEIEVTERTAAVGSTRAPETLAELRQWGVRVALDDFGTGYSALSQLTAYPLDTVKIDRSFIAQLSRGASAEAIVRAIIAMSNALGMSVVAEGVETQEQLEFLRDNRCDAVQGYLLARPVPVEHMDAALEAAARVARPVPERVSPG